MAIEARKTCNIMMYKHRRRSSSQQDPRTLAPVAPSHHRAVFAHVANNTRCALFLATNASACSAPQLDVLRLVQDEGPVKFIKASSGFDWGSEDFRGPEVGRLGALVTTRGPTTVVSAAAR